MLAGAVMSTATTCGPPERQPDMVLPDTAGRPPDTGFVRDVGFTVIENGAFDLRGEGSVATVTVRATLSERCLREVPEYSWGYPPGWVVLGYEVGLAPPDTGGDSGGADTGDTAAASAPGDTGAPDTSDTSAVDTSWAEDTGVVDTSAGGETGAVDTGAVDTDAADTGAVDTDAEDTGAIDTGAVDTGPDTSAADTGGTDTGWGDTADTGPAADARVLLGVDGSDGTSLGEVRLRLFEGSTVRGSLTTERPFVSCAPDAACEVAWTMAFTLVEGEAVHGDIEAHVRLNMCSSGDPEESDLSVVVE